MSGQYCKCPNHIRDYREHSLGGHLGHCDGCCFAKDLADSQHRVSDLAKTDSATSTDSSNPPTGYKLKEKD